MATEINEPGIYANVPEEDYHADCYPISLSNSVAKIIINKSAAHARLQHPRLNPGYKAEQKKAYDLGSAVHCIVLEDEPKIACLDYPDWRTKAAKEERDDLYDKGVVPMLAHDYEQALEMAKAFRAQLSGEVLAAFEGGEHTEATLCWDEPVDGQSIRCRARVDRLNFAMGCHIDIKTTSMSANPTEFMRQFFRLQYDLQAEWYLRGIHRLTGDDSATFLFIVQETAPPYCLKTFGVSAAALEIARDRNDRALRAWAAGLKTGDWPGYGEGIEFLGPTDWMIIQHEEEKMREEMGL